MWGTTRSLVNNAVLGVSEGFTKKLEVNGVGYRAQVQGKKINLQLGFSHDISYEVPEGIKIEVEGDRGNVIAISGPDKQVVGQVASEIRSCKPEPTRARGLSMSTSRYSARKARRSKGVWTMLNNKKLFERRKRRTRHRLRKVERIKPRLSVFLFEQSHLCTGHR